MVTMTNKLKMFVVLTALFLVVASTSTFAGTLTPLANRTFASEALGTTTAVTLADLEYLMGVSRAVGQAYHIRFTIAGGTWTTPVPPGTGVGTSPPFIAGQFSAKTGTGGGGLVTTQLFSSTATVLEYAVGIISPTDNTLVLVLPAAQAIFGANAIGSTMTVTVDCFDSFGAIDADATPRTVANIGTAASYTTLATDTGTIVDATVTPPASAFVAGGDDVAQRAESAITMTNNGGALAPAGGAAYTLVAGDVVTITVMGDFTGLGNGFFLDLNDNDTPDTGEVFTVGGTTATLAVPGNVFTGAHSIAFAKSATAQLTAPRTFSIAAQVVPAAVGGLTRTLSTGSATWWVWGNNGTRLVAQYVTFDAGIPVKFRFTNYSASTVVVTTAVQIDANNTGAALTNALPSFTIPASSSVTVELLNTPVAGTGTLGPLVTGVAGTMPIRGRATFTVLTVTNNVEGQLLMAGAAGIVIQPLSQMGVPNFIH